VPGWCVPANTVSRSKRVCWGGFKSSVMQEARQSFFTIRLWDSGDLQGMILRNHDRFPDELKAELPLKRIWALVLEE
jgi:restriction system protein